MTAMKYLGDGSVIIGTRHRNRDTKIMKIGKTSGTWNEKGDIKTSLKRNLPQNS